MCGNECLVQNESWDEILRLSTKFILNFSTFKSYLFTFPIFSWVVLTYSTTRELSQTIIWNPLPSSGVKLSNDLNCSLLEKISEYRKKPRKIISLRDNAPSHTAKPIHDTLEVLGWEVLLRAAYSPGLAPSNYHLFAPMGHALAEQRFGSYEDVKKWLWLDERFAANEVDFTGEVFINYPKKWENV